MFAALRAMFRRLLAIDLDRGPIDVAGGLDDYTIPQRCPRCGTFMYARGVHYYGAAFQPASQWCDCPPKTSYFPGERHGRLYDSPRFDRDDHDVHRWHDDGGPCRD